MSTTDYDLFAEIVAAGSLSEAARRLRISTAVVSKRLVRLESRLGVKLVHRTTRRMALTRVGESFHEDAVAVLAAVRAAEERIAGIIREPSGPLRVSAPTSFARLHVAPLLQDFLSLWPRIELELLLSDEYVDLAAERIDVAIRIGTHVPAGIVAHRLASNRRLLAASPGYIAAHGMPGSLEELAQHRLLAADGQLPWRLESGKRRRVIEGRSYVRTNSSEIVRELALAGVGIALRSVWDVSDELRDGRLLQILPSWESTRDLAIYAMNLEGTEDSPAIAALLSFLRSNITSARWDDAENT